MERVKNLKKHAQKHFQRSVGKNTDLTKRMIRRHTTLKRHITEHPTLIYLQSTHTYFVSAIAVN